MVIQRKASEPRQGEEGPRSGGQPEAGVRARVGGGGHRACEGVAVERDELCRGD